MKHGWLGVYQDKESVYQPIKGTNISEHMFPTFLHMVMYKGWSPVIYISEINNKQGWIADILVPTYEKKSLFALK